VAERWVRVVLKVAEPMQVEGAGAGGVFAGEVGGGVGGRGKGERRVLVGVAALNAAGVVLEEELTGGGGAVGEREATG
jgi:hypothetical protein